MSWLHTWAGLCVSWVLYFVWVTGTFGYVKDEVTRWMTPELPLISARAAVASSAELVQQAEARLKAGAHDPVWWYMALPSDVRRGSWPNRFEVGWQGPDDESEADDGYEALDPHTGRPREVAPRETSGGHGLYEMHFALHYMPQELAQHIVVVCSMIMLVALLTGLVVHKKIFKDFFTFRPARGQRSWLDGHNLSSVASLPFQLMITLSGLFFYQFSLLPAGILGAYTGDDRQGQFASELEGRHEGDDAPRPSPLQTPLVRLVAAVEARWGERSISYIQSDRGPEGPRIRVYRNQRSPSDVEYELCFDAITGARLEGRQPSGPEVFQETMATLHIGQFASPLLRFLYVLSGLAGATMIGTGLVHWTAKRKAQFERGRKPSFGFALVDALNVATLVGLPAGIAAYFWANRLVPAQLDGRSEWELHALFIVWGMCFPNAALRTPRRAWAELCWLAAALTALLPALNAITTQRHLGVSVPAGDWVLVGFDASALAVGAFFAWLGHTIRRHQAAPAGR